MKVKAIKTEEYYIRRKPYYLPAGKESELFESAYHNQIPVLLPYPEGKFKIKRGTLSPFHCCIKFWWLIKRLL